MRKQLLIVGMTTFKGIVGNKKVIETILVLGLLLFAACTITVKAPGPTTVLLGSAANFSVLAASAVSNTGPTIVTGDVGLTPTTGAAITGFPPGAVTGMIYAVDAFGPAGSVNNPGLLTTAKNDLNTAYLDAAGRPTTATIATELGGTTLTAGVYNSAAGTFGITGTLTLNGEGDPNAVFIFQMESTLITATGSVVSLINDAQACNVFWQVGSSATLGTGTTFVGDILAYTSITLTSGVTVEGRLLALDAAVTLDTNTITTTDFESIVLTQLTDTNPVDTPHTVTATVAGTGDPVPDVSVTFVVSGTNTLTSLPILTDIHGRASFTYTSHVPGIDHIVARFENNQGDTVTSNEVTKTWTFFVVPESALGALTAVGVGFAAFGVVKMKRARNEKR